MQKTNFIGAILSLIFIVGAAAGVNFAQADSKNWNQKRMNELPIVGRYAMKAANK